MPAITFAIPFYKNRDYLARAAASVFAQTTSDWSLVISHDAGPEPDLTDWIAGLPYLDKITYIRQPANLGLAGNWNACLALARTELVTLLHGDDELEPHYAQVMTDAANRHPGASVFFCRASVIDAAGRETFSFPDWFKRWLMPAPGAEFAVGGEEGLRSVYRGNFIMCPTMCYRRRDLPETPFNTRWRQVLDLDFITRTLLAGRTLVGLPQRAYRYRRHSGNQTLLQSESLVRFEEERDLYRETAAAAEARGWTRAAKTCRRLAIVKMNLGYCILQDLARLQIKNAAAKMKFLAGLIVARRSAS